ncbi:hypothetical protein K2173_025142 [Erythroxylum novogranatense]|uniref:RNase H type-1 domain-containing protein n=1 Tax=Erythroxylum novogranatense TaxID=1862640 RepID=A0AAV8SWQ8_9ROSI|nr:hypothetical protein K2173_025142 [Erythroxylum novogranatense]
MLLLFNNSDASLALGVCYAIWNARNAIVWNSRIQNPLGTWFAARRTQDEWRNAQESVTNVQQGVKVVKWQKPSPGWVKINLDAATNVHSDSTGVAMIVRDDHGNFLAAKNMCLLGSFTPKVAEAMALKEALSWLQDKGWEQVVCESDCLEVIQAVINRDWQDLTSFGAIIDDIRRLQAQSRQQIHFNVVKRSGNCVAHSLDQATRLCSNVGEWFVNPPNYIRDVLLTDIT